MEVFSTTTSSENIHVPIQDAFENFLKKLQEINDDLFQPINVFSAVEELRTKQHFSWNSWKIQM